MQIKFHSLPLTFFNKNFQNLLSLYLIYNTYVKIIPIRQIIMRLKLKFLDYFHQSFFI